MQTRLQKIAHGEFTIKLLREREEQLRLALHDRKSPETRVSAHRDLIALFSEIRAAKVELKKLEGAPSTERPNINKQVDIL